MGDIAVLSPLKLLEGQDFSPPLLLPSLSLIENINILLI